jgi:hypothetical protein
MEMGQASRSQPALDDLILQPSQVGREYVVKVIPGGRAVHRQVTLDMCGFRFLSENLRIARLQTAYIRRRATLEVSNELVRYRAGGASLAMTEISNAIRTCPRTPVPSTIQGVPPLTYRIKRLSATNHRLLRGAIAIRITMSGTLKGRHLSETDFVVYQRRGDVLSGVYTDGGLIAARQALALSAAAQSARNLRQH